MIDYSTEKLRAMDYIMEHKKLTREQIRMKIAGIMEQYIKNSNGMIDMQRHRHMIDLYALKQLIRKGM